MEFLYALVAVVLLIYWYYLYTSPQQLVISCTSINGNIPKALQWADVLVRDYPGKYDITIVLHGEALKLGLTNNPHQTIMAGLAKQGVKFRICQLCLNEQSPEIKKDKKYAESTLLDFVKPVPFSVDYIAKRANNKIGHSRVIVLWE